MNDDVLRLKKDIAALKSILPSRVDPARISHISKIPYKVADLRAGLLYRIYSLTDDSFTLFSKNKVLSGTIIARSLIETVSVFYYLCSKMDTCIKDRNISVFDEVVMKLILGSRNGITDIDSINILTIISKIDKDLKVDNNSRGFKFCYELMCEYAHPNWKGTEGLYGEINFDQVYTDFGFNLKDEFKKEMPSRILPVATSMEITISCIEWFDKIMDNFIKVCEDDINSKSKTYPGG